MFATFRIDRDELPVVRGFELLTEPGLVLALGFNRSIGGLVWHLNRDSVGGTGRITMCCTGAMWLRSASDYAVAFGIVPLRPILHSTTLPGERWRYPIECSAA